MQWKLLAFLRLLSVAVERRTHRRSLPAQNLTNLSLNGVEITKMPLVVAAGAAFLVPTRATSGDYPAIAASKG